MDDTYFINLMVSIRRALTMTNCLTTLLKTDFVYETYSFIARFETFMVMKIQVVF